MQVRTPVKVLVLLVVITTNAWGVAPALYKVETGQFETGVASGVEVHIPGRNRNMLLRVSYPKGTGPFPLIVFFHGALCSADGYADLADHWASHGYVVILPSHPSAGRSARGDQEQQIRAFREQVADMSSILDSLDAITTEIPPLADAIDPSRIAAAGHSMGALIATIVGGLPRLEPDGSHLSLKDDRFDALVLLSGPGPLPLTPQNGWESVTLPTLVTTGTRDHANRGGEGATWEWRLGAYKLTPPGDRYGLVIDEADHFLGGMICAERADGPPDHEAFAIVESVSTAFLDAYLKNNQSAFDYLHGSAITEATNGRAELLSR
jgi:predicted dienelactone hydrolase